MFFCEYSGIGIFGEDDSRCCFGISVFFLRCEQNAAPNHGLLAMQRKSFLYLIFLKVLAGK